MGAPGADRDADDRRARRLADRDRRPDGPRQARRDAGGRARKLLGIATLTDILDGEVRSSMTQPSPSSLTAAEVMMPYPFAVQPETFLVDAVSIMIERRLRHLPVVDTSSTIDRRAGRDRPVRRVDRHRVLRRRAARARAGSLTPRGHATRQLASRTSLMSACSVQSPEARCSLRIQEASIWARSCACRSISAQVVRSTPVRSGPHSRTNEAVCAIRSSATMIVQCACMVSTRVNRVVPPIRHEPAQDLRDPRRGATSSSIRSHLAVAAESVRCLSAVAASLRAWLRSPAWS